MVFLCSIEVIFLPCVVDAIGAAQNETKHGRECGALSKPFELGDSLKCRRRIFKTQPFALSLNQKTVIVHVFNCYGTAPLEVATFSAQLL